MPLLGSCWELICSLLLDFCLSLADGPEDTIVSASLSLCSFSLYSPVGAPPRLPQNPCKDVGRSLMSRTVSEGNTLESAQMYLELCSSHVPCHTLNPKSVPFLLWDSQHVSSPVFLSSVLSVQQHCSYLRTLRTPQEHLDAALGAPMEFLPPWDNFSVTKSHSKN